jgi:NitT/TauT family transport system substrate-binding protein
METTMMQPRRFALALATAALASAMLPAAAQDKITVTIGQRGNWDTAISHLGTKAGIFKKHGLELNLLYTSGSGETLQPVIAGSAEIGAAVGTQGAMAAYAKGAPVRIIGAEATGAADYWYAKTSSTIKSLQDANGRTIAFSTQGSSTQSIVRAFIDEFKLTARPISTGNPAATLTAVMTGQVDVGWASPPFGLKEIDAGQIRVIARATNSALVRGQTVRVLVTNVDTLTKRKDVVSRFLDAYRETIDYMYLDDPTNIMNAGMTPALEDYAEFVGVPPRMATRVRDEFFPKELVNPDEIKGLDALVKEAVNLKFIDKPLTAQQLAELIQIPPRTK